ncbi:MAG: glycosyltransferase family 2 protein [Omnitrophica bacterium]|nr:glycosyltransferase family 2 protein [Candidatus Omnitrophota bacterium]
MKCDIIIPVWNQLEYTKASLASLFKHTRLHFRLIIVDNASGPQTAEYLDSVKENHSEQVVLIRNTENLGFVKATNQGLRESSAPYLCLLNNDTEVTEGWLSEMLKVAEAREDIGIVNANSNTLGCKPKRGQTPESLAQELKTYTGKYSELAWATGFCMLIKRKVIQEVGLFDEIYGMGNFEDADFSKRAQQLGYFSVCAKASYVYHRERRSFIKHERFNQNFRRNRQIFFAKWGKMQRILYVLSKDNSTDTEKINAESLKLARQGHIVWILLKEQNKQKIKQHSNIYIYNLPKQFFGLISFWRILKRKKKFDKIYVDDQNYGKRLNSFKSLHKAEVIYEQ